jgi:hypothetical protein
MNNLKNCSATTLFGGRQGNYLSKNLTIILITGIFIFQSCGPSKQEMEYKEKSMEISDSIKNYSAGLATDTINGITHNFIRTAEMKLKVNDVLSTTQKIEDLIALSGGYLTKSEMTAENESDYTVRFSKDSLKEIKEYTMVNYLTIRVPNKQLDTVLRSITRMAVFINYSRLTADDVKMKLFANSLAQKRNKKFVQKTERNLGQSTAKLKQITEAEEKILEKELLADEKQMESYTLVDQVNYSTVNLHLYQPNVRSVQTQPMPEIVESYEPSFLSKLIDAFVNGFDGIKKFILGLVGNWDLILILAAILFTVKKIYGYFNMKVVTAEK